MVLLQKKTSAKREPVEIGCNLLLSKNASKSSGSNISRLSSSAFDFFASLRFSCRMYARSS